MTEEIYSFIDEEIDEELTRRYRSPYCVIDHNLFELRKVKDGITKKELGNFVPWIRSQVTVYDGEKEFNRLRLSGLDENGNSLRQIEVDAKEFQSMNWLLDKWGADCNIAVGGGSREHLRHAIQSTMKHAERTSLYTVTGWIRVNGSWEYLMPDADGFDVSLPGKLKSYSLPGCENAGDLSLAASMLRGLPAKDELMLPLMAFAFLSPLNHFLREAAAEPKFVLFLCGRTGTKKSTLAALILSFFGKFSAANLPLSFRDTGNSIVSNLFSLKDVLTCIDDFHPAGRYEESSMNTTAQTVMRAVGDRTGRARLNQHSELMSSRPPQGNVIITGELPPEIGESGTARYLMLEVKPGDVYEAPLTFVQACAEKGVLRSIMRGYIRWLKETFLADETHKAELLARLKEIFIRAREQYAHRLSDRGVSVHARIPEALAGLQIGLTFLLEFLVSRNAVSEEERDQLLHRFTGVMTEYALRQAKSVAEDKPTHKFLSKLFALVDSGRLLLAEKGSGSDQKIIGYYDDTSYYLFGQEAHRIVKRFCEEQGEIFSITPKALFKALVEEGFAESDGSENTRVLRIGGKQRHFLVLSRGSVDPLLGTFLPQNQPSQTSQTEVADVPARDPETEDLPF